ncbi:MAG: asparaginase domain-containing protein [Synergistes sp.]|nr:asparaginase domain-containing protein [Synergistes sp.]
MTHKKDGVCRVLIIPTGGTIGSLGGLGTVGAVSDAGAVRDITNFAADVLHEYGCIGTVNTLFGAVGMDSSDMSPYEWGKLSNAIHSAAKEGIKKILIIHGTDTMAYTAAWLSLTVPRDVTVVLTGSQRTADAPDFDGIRNVEGAVRTLCEKQRGVYIHFDGRDFKGAFVSKEDAQAFSAYTESSSEDMPDVYFHENYFEHCERWQDIAKNICVMNVSPLFTHSPDECKILLVVGYGAGNMPQRIIRTIAESCVKCEKRPIVICASACVKGAKNPCAYSGVGAGVLAEHGFHVYSQGGYSYEFLIALSFFALCVDSEEPEKVIAQWLDKVKK